MRKHYFSLGVSGGLELTEALAYSLYVAGCDDATPGLCEGILTIDFHRDAASLEQAIRTAITDVHRAGLGVERVEIDAERVGVGSPCPDEPPSARRWASSSSPARKSSR